ncbi:DNA starvation/stationary phase protection protein [Tsukamurella tyrosinosolvens]|uniref:Dps family protein n=1 Tax=Tsukamurella tyrosinosolvens TaxID=57704 RepID=UPI0007990A10|nr:DNA starvation/stationary phase protection protein [Tsukamurella tyrosinosolvens]AUN41473.1 DNA starvation/stationary phase protection protein [Tsukamurella tyrosinosolvens]KXP04807.1 DNA starvation/stationary phase protection protein [Tsukamurella tyrosinosolvens]KZL98061.1 DNA starvation/stationary phase protection protein [Tsukamurella tyrosinosolvens]MCA4995281.1 DNA starvation/stationary phase protection protein [Tsukamurella tyrosinosolvens]
MTTFDENVPATVEFSVPGLVAADADELVGLLKDRLTALVDLALTLKHVHWNVVGPHFIGAHHMVDDHVGTVRRMVDETAERIAALGGVPRGTPGAVVTQRNWDDYSVDRADAVAHMTALDAVYVGVIESYRAAVSASADRDPMTQDMLIDHCRALEQLHWMVRAHLEGENGEIGRTP